MVLEKLVGLYGPHIDKHAIYTNFFAIVAISIFVFALRDKRKNFYGGRMTWKQGFISGLIISLIVTLFSPISQIIINKLISPEYFPNMIAYTVENGLKTQEEAEAYFNLQSYIIQSIIGTIVMGVITSAIVAIFLKKK